MKNIIFKPIGIIHSPNKAVENTPIQPRGAKGVKGTVELYSDFIPGLKDIDGFSHIILIYHFNRVKSYKLLATPFLDTAEHGIFSIRAPARPNPIGISIVELEKIENNVLHVVNIDILDKTPILDIKPYITEFDSFPNAVNGWSDGKLNKLDKTKDDGRFI